MKRQALIISSLILALSTSVQAATNPQLGNKKNDNAAIGWLIVINKGEIAAAKEAKKRNVNPAITEFADFMIEEHSKNLDQTLDLSKKAGLRPLKDKSTLAAEKKAKASLNKMQKMNDKQFQKTYVDLMVIDHSNALNAIKNYSSKVNNSDLKTHITKTKDHIADHLQKAKNLKNGEQQTTQTTQ